MSVQQTLEQSAASWGFPISTKAELTRARILDAAVTVLTSSQEANVSIVEIASEAGISSQGVYRYFHNKHELFLAAVEEDFNRFAFEVLGSIAELPAPYLTGVFWRRVVDVMPNHALAVNSVVSRNPDVLDRVNSSSGAAIITEALREEVLKAFENKILRQDLEPNAQAAASCYMMMNVSIPLAFAGKYNTDDWFALQGTQLAAAFYPVPNFQDPVVARKFEEQMSFLGQNKTLINYKFR